MIFAFEDDTTLTIHADIIAATHGHEPIDVEDGSVVFFVDDGTPLRPRFMRPHRRRFFGVLIDQGEFVLEPPGAAGVSDDIRAALDRATAVNPNPHFDTLEAVREHVALRRSRSGGGMSWVNDVPASGPLQETQSRLKSGALRRVTGEIILPVTVVAILGLVGIALLFGVIDETAGLALGLCLVASVGGAIVAILSLRLSRHLDLPVTQATGLHPGWLRYGPVGGVGGIVAILGFVVTSLLRAPLFIPVILATAVLGVCLAAVLYRARLAGKDLGRRE